MEDKVKELAETLRKQGLAVSEYEAVEKAKSILDIKPSEILQEKKEDRFSKTDYDISKEKSSLNELMEDVGVDSKEPEQEKVENTINGGKQTAKAVQSPTESSMNQKIDTGTMDKSEDSNETNQPADRFKEEKKIDLTKIFNYRK